MTTGRINQVTAFPETEQPPISQRPESPRSIDGSPARFQLHEAEECLEGFLSEMGTSTTAHQCV